MKKTFEQLSKKNTFMKKNGGILFRKLSKDNYEFKVTIKKHHLNNAGITHGGFICSIIDAGAGTAAHRSISNKPCVTISLDVKFIGATKLDDSIFGNVEIAKITQTLIFLNCTLKCKKKIIASASGIWKILKIKTSSNYGPGG